MFVCISDRQSVSLSIVLVNNFASIRKFICILFVLYLVRCNACNGSAVNGGVNK